MYNENILQKIIYKCILFYEIFNPNNMDATLPIINVIPAEPSPKNIISTIFLLIDRFAEIAIRNPVTDNANTANINDNTSGINIGKPKNTVLMVQMLRPYRTSLYILLP